MRPKTDLKAWRRRHSGPTLVEWLLSFVLLFVFLTMITTAVLTEKRLQISSCWHNFLLSLSVQARLLRVYHKV